jgi:hypothetical protein
VSEYDEQFAGTAARSTKHNPRLDEELESEEWREVEPVAEGDPDIDTSPDGTLVGGTPVGMDADAVTARAEIARWLDRADFPSTGPALVEAALDHRAPDAVVAELQRLPDGETFERVGDVVRALGYPTET